MRRTLMATALACAVGVAGCGSGGGTGSGTAPGIREGTFKITVQNTAPIAITGGKVTSSPAGIECGVGVASQRCEASFPNGTAVTMTAAPVSPNLFLGWSGDCSGEGACVLTGNADRYLVVQFGTDRTSHPNWTSGPIHAARYAEFVSGAAGALDCTSCHGTSLAGQGIAVACNGCHALPTPDTRPQLFVARSGDQVGSPVSLTLTAKDLNPRDTIRCSATLLGSPAGSTATLAGAAAFDCRAAAQVVTFSPNLGGLYTVRASVNDGLNTVIQDVFVGVTAYTGGAVTGVASAPSDTLTGTLDRLRQDITLIPSYGTGLAAANVYRALANIAPVAPPTNGTASTQGPVLGWSARPYDMIDVRDPSNFAAGHIPGAVNVPLQDLPDVLLARPWFPAADQASSKPALVVGYTTGDSSLGAVVVTVGRASSGVTLPAGNVNFLSNGMATWTFDKAAVPFRWSDDLGKYRHEFKLTDSGPGGNYLESGGSWPATPVGTGFAGKPTFGHPTVSDFTGELAVTNTTIVPAMKRILVRLREWTAWARADALARGMTPAEAFVTHWGFYKQLRDAGEPYHVLTRQDATQWAVARPVGAFRGDDVVNSSGVITQASFKYVDPARETLVNCFTNGSAVRPCFVLSILGYKVRSVMYGIGGLLSWDIVGAGSTGGNGFNNIAALQDGGAGGNDFPVSASSVDSQDLAWTQPAGAGCKSCHTDYGVQYTLVAKQPSAPTPEVLSEGEG